MTPAIPLDLHWLGHPRSIASASLRLGDCVALVDPGPSSTIPHLREQLAVHGLRIGDLDALFLTHIHRVALFPGLLVHPALKVGVLRKCIQGKLAGAALRLDLAGSGAASPALVFRDRLRLGPSVFSTSLPSGPATGLLGAACR